MESSRQIFQGGESEKKDDGGGKWADWRTKTDNFLTNIKTKFSDQERRSSGGRKEKVC